MLNNEMNDPNYLDISKCSVSTVAVMLHYVLINK